MPFASKAQKKKMQQLLAAGEITERQYREMEEGTSEERFLPERVASHDPDAPTEPRKKKVSPFW